MCREAPPPKKVVDDYLGDMDLPSSESEDEAPVAVRNEEKKEIVRVAQVSPSKDGQPLHSCSSKACFAIHPLSNQARAVASGITNTCRTASFTHCSARLLVLFDEHPVIVQASVKEQKKLADKERKLLEKAHREKESALRDDDNVFDVAFENQGANATDVASATDIKVNALPPICHIQTQC